MFGGGVLLIRSLILRLKGINVNKWGSGVSFTTSVLVFFVVSPVAPVKFDTAEPAAVEASSPVVMEVPVTEGGPPPDLS